MNRFLYVIAKTWAGSVLLHWIIANFSFVIPGEKLIETDTVIAFHDPAPSYPMHILILPKSNYNSLIDLPTDDLAFEYALFSAVNQLVQKF
jgi:diadenosine tetraphosphate (Ap4A) HIT family hydrolase